MFKPGSCSTNPSSLQHSGREGWPGKALGAGMKLHWRGEVVFAPRLALLGSLPRVSSSGKSRGGKEPFKQTACCKNCEYVGLGENQTLSLFPPA